MNDPHVRQTSEMLNAIRAEFAHLPKQIAEDVREPELRWNWARELYWGYGCPKEQIAEYLLQCPVERVPDLVGPSPKSLKCVRCKFEFFPASVEEWRSAFLAGMERNVGEERGPCAQSARLYSAGLPVRCTLFGYQMADGKLRRRLEAALTGDGWEINNSSVRFAIVNGCSISGVKLVQGNHVRLR